MSFLETNSFCGLSEYLAHRDHRILESDIETMELYTYMMRLDDPEVDAAMQTVRVERMVRHAGFVAVKFSFLDDDLDIDHTEIENVSNGYIEVHSRAVFVCNDTGHKSPVIEAYLRDYDEYDWLEELRKQQVLSLVSRQ